ncbi:hypothetical protein CAEBREN_13045 [Caenorhabditis brenneri]|uniref:F-box domain-containing protein n=1 Tax=Caenorhabditis brenneri TaxID=135651 RepID=G0PIM7_CAEBE|nr:hypothetical protein CAEBREN_13045 [Caenorhabditis brenneri]
MPTLLEMPPEILTEIAGFVGFPEIFTLGQTCRDLKSFVDDLKLNHKLKSLSIRVSTDKMSLGCEQEDKKYSINFKKSDEDQFFKSLEQILKFQTSTLTEFFIEDPSPMPGFYCKMKIILESRPSLLKVYELSMKCKNQYQICSILSSLKPGTLERINISTLCWNKLKLNKVAKLDQWKEAKKLRIDGFTVSAHLTVLSSFQSIEVFSKTIFWTDLVMLKKLFLTTPNISRSCIIRYGCLIGENQWYKSLGPPTYEAFPCWEPYWKYFYPNSNGGFQIEWFYDFNDIRFETFY